MGDSIFPSIFFLRYASSVIMIVDDNPHIRALIRRHVEVLQNDSDFFECDDGLAAVEAYRKLRPTIVLMDIKMNGMDGLTATENILHMDPSARVIIVSNFDEPELRLAAERAGARGYVLKEELQTIRELMQ